MKANGYLGKQWQIPLVLSVLFLFLYLAVTTNSHISYGQDSLEFSYWIETDAITKINRHFLWNILFYFVFKAYVFLGGEQSSLFIGQCISAVFGAVGLGVFYLVLASIKPEGLKKLDCVIFTTLLGCSFSYWHFSTEATPQLFSTFLRLLLLLSLLHHREILSAWKIVFFGICLGLVLLSELMAFYLIIPFCYLVYRFCVRSKISVAHVFSFVFCGIGTYFLIYSLGAMFLLGIDFVEIIPSILYRGANTTNYLTDIPIGLLYLLQGILFFPGLITTSIAIQESADFSKLLYPQYLAFLLFVSYFFLFTRKMMKSRKLLTKELFICCCLWWIILVVVQLLREPRALDNINYSVTPFIICLFILYDYSLQGVGGTSFSKRFMVVVMLAICCLHNFWWGILPNSRFGGYEMSEYQRFVEKQLGNVGPEDTILLLSDCENYGLYELYYIEKNVKRKAHLMLVDGSPSHAYSPKYDIIEYDQKLEVLEENRGRVYLFAFPVELEENNREEFAFKYLYDRLRLHSEGVDSFWENDDRIEIAKEIIDKLAMQFSVVEFKYDGDLSILYLAFARSKSGNP